MVDLLCSMDLNLIYKYKLKHVTQIVLDSIKRDRKKMEFTVTYDAYLHNKIDQTQFRQILYKEEDAKVDPAEVIKNAESFINRLQRKE